MDNLFLLLFFVSIIALVIGLIKPTTFTRLLKGRATRKSSTGIFGIAAFIFLVLFGMATDPSTSPIENQINQKNKQTNEQEVITQGEPVAYEITESEDQSHKALGSKSLSDYSLQELTNLPTDKKMRYRIVISPEIKENQVRPTIEKIIVDITSQDNDIDEISLLLYSDRGLTNEGYDVAMATWAPNGKLGNITPEIAQSNDRTNYKITTQIRSNLEEYLQKRGQSEDKYGFTESERRQIFKEIVAAEDRARAEADELYTTNIVDSDYKQENLEKNSNKSRELGEKYKSQVRAKYGITEDIENKIVAESFKESWPLE